MAELGNNSYNLSPRYSTHSHWQRTVFLDIGAERGIHGEGDRSRIWPKLFVVAESMCMGEGEVDLLRLEWTMELQLEQFRVQTGKVLWVILDRKK